MHIIVKASLFYSKKRSLICGLLIKSSIASPDVSKPVGRVKYRMRMGQERTGQEREDKHIETTSFLRWFLKRC